MIDRFVSFTRFMADKWQENLASRKTGNIELQISIINLLVNYDVNIRFLFCKKNKNMRSFYSLIKKFCLAINTS